MSDNNSNNTENLLKSWSEAQQKLLTDWLDTVRKLGGSSGMELWTKTVDAWQSSIKATLDAQAQWSHEWTEILAKARGTPEEMQNLAKEGREQLQNWADAQRELWQGWFNAVREINFRPEAAAGAKLEKDIVQIWQDTAHKMIDAQAALVRRWTGGGTKK